MKVLAVELAAFDIRVNSVHPCGVATDLVLNQPGLDLFAGKEGATFADAEPGMKSLNLLDVALIQPEDVTAAILFLLSDAARYVTGLSMTVDAGTTVCPPGSFPRLADRRPLPPEPRNLRRGPDPSAGSHTMSRAFPGWCPPEGALLRASPADRPEVLVDEAHDRRAVAAHRRSGTSWTAWT